MFPQSTSRSCEAAGEGNWNFWRRGAGERVGGKPFALPTAVNVLAAPAFRIRRFSFSKCAEVWTQGVPSVIYNQIWMYFARQQLNIPKENMTPCVESYVIVRLLLRDSIFMCETVKVASMPVISAHQRRETTPLHSPFPQHAPDK